MRRTLRFSVYEGVAAEVVGACSGSTILTAWALYVRASPMALGLIVALPQLAQLVQLPAAWITSRAGSRRTAIWAVGLSRQSLLLLCALPWTPEGKPREALLVATASVSTALAVVGNNAWVTWMGGLLPRHLRGRYFGARTAVITCANGVGALGAGLVLDLGRREQREGLSLAFLSLMGAVAGLVALVLMREQHARREAQRPGSLLSDLVSPLRDEDGQRLLAFQATWNLAVGLAGSFFTVFMLRELRMSYVQVAAYGVATSVFKVLFAAHWGRTIDRVGTRPVVIICSLWIGLIPFLWLLAGPGTLWPVALDAVATGIFWGGHNQAVFQLPLAIAPSRDRAWHIAAFSTIAGGSFAVATLAGGWLLGQWSPVLTPAGHELSSYQALFALSGVARLLAAFASMRLLAPDLGRSAQPARLSFFAPFG